MNRLKMRTSHFRPSRNGGKMAIREAKAKVVQSALEWVKTFGTAIPELGAAEESLFKTTLELQKLQEQG